MIAEIINYVLEAYSILIIINALLSWIPGSYNWKITQLISGAVEPYLSIFQRIIPPIFGLDFSPVFALLLLQVISNIVNSLL